MTAKRKDIRAGRRLGKYQLRRRIASGGFADVYVALDTVERCNVALKIPHAEELTKQVLEDFSREVRLGGQLEHPNILPLKNADRIDDVLVMAYPLGVSTLDTRREKRLGLRAALDYAEQMLAALAFAHERGIIHCDVKPDNLILFDDGRLRLTDFGVAKVALNTVVASASGTPDYMAPEQAMGRPSARSDVFAAAIVIYQMLTGALPAWPYEWPLVGYERLHRKAPALEPVLRKALQVHGRHRQRDAGELLHEFRSAKKRTLARATKRKNAKRKSVKVGTTSKDWMAVRIGQFRRRYGAKFSLKGSCARCHNPVDERMHACPWCGDMPLHNEAESAFPTQCSRCQRGLKLDWTYCPWCYGGKVGPESERHFSDKRYCARCVKCEGRLMALMRYCPWCNKKVTRRWGIGPGARPCGRCGEAVASEFWSHCASCGYALRKGGA